MTPSTRQKAPLRLLHASDLHIGNDIYPEDALWGFEAALARGQEMGVDVILIAGDLFDSFRVPDATVGRVLKDLGAVGRPVVVLPGNHDVVLTNGQWSGWLPGNVTILKEAEGELVFLPDLDLTVWGRPVYDHHPGFRPLEGLPPRSRNGWYVPMAHGMFMGLHVEHFRSSPITAEEIAQAECDYIALGHVHVFRDVSQNGVPAFYCGAPSGPQAKSVALVELDPQAGVTVSPVQIP